MTAVHNSAFNEIDKSLKQIKQLLGNVHVDGNTIKNLEIDIENLKDIAEDLNSEWLPLHLKVNVTEEKLFATKDAFDELYDKFNELRDSLDDLTDEEDNLKQGSIDGALNITRESIERLKKAQRTMTETHDILQEVALACNNLTKSSFSHENITAEAIRDQLNVSQTIFNELVTNYTHFNAKMCQVVNVTCQVQNCSDIFCMFKVQTDLKEKVELLDNALKEMKNKEREFDHMQNTLEKLQDEYTQAKTRNYEALLEVKAKLDVFNRTQHDFNKTIDELRGFRNISNMKVEIRNINDSLLEVNFLEDEEYLKELITKINGALINITEAHELLKEAAKEQTKAEQLLIKAMDAR